MLAAQVAQSVLGQLTGVPADQRVQALARLLVVDAFTARTRAVLDPVTDPRQLITLGLASPEYAVC